MLIHSGVNFWSFQSSEEDGGNTNPTSSDSGVGGMQRGSKEGLKKKPSASPKLFKKTEKAPSSKRSPLHQSIQGRKRVDKRAEERRKMLCERTARRLVEEAVELSVCEVRKEETHLRALEEQQRVVVV